MFGSVKVRLDNDSAVKLRRAAPSIASVDRTASESADVPLLNFPLYPARTRIARGC